MNKAAYSAIENHMLSLMKDSAHDCQHIYRVLYYSLDIARDTAIDLDVLIAAALLHDIGRAAEYTDRTADHALVGADMACGFLLTLGWAETNAQHVKDCIASHRYRNDIQPQSTEAKILFDADKLDATGTIGIARTIMYKGIVGQPLYAVDGSGAVLTGIEDKRKSVFQEYNWKLKGIYERFYTKRAQEIALGRRQAAIDCYNSMLTEVSFAHNTGAALLGSILGEGETSGPA
jgi:uncharacterized protein